MTTPLTSQDLIKTLDTLTADWHVQDNEEHTVTDGYRGAAVTIHINNYRLWHEEDKARVTGVPDADIAQVKRNIDTLNQQRNDAIERWDEKLITQLQSNVKAPVDIINSETPGSIVDRLSIMTLKVYHMAEQTERDDVDAEHIENCRQKVAVLQRQRADLGECLDRLLAELLAGEKTLRVYRQFKMYNDPSLNPEVYGAANQASPSTP